MTGIHCSTCQTTYWPERSETAYDFNDFEAHVVRARDYFERHRDWGPLLSDPDHVIEGLTDCSVSIVDRFATPNELAPGVTLIKSPKGTGKTRGLADLISRAPSLLLIGHRRTLIRHTCERLGLEVYLDHEGSLTGLPRLGICLDSLARIPASEGYRIVILDESEQVLAHLLSDTVEGPGKPGRDRLFIELSHRVQSAERTVALNADMSWITYDTLLRMQTRLTRASNKAVLPPVRIWINQQKIRAGQPPILLFESQQHLVSELEVAVDEGQKCFVTSNSKTVIERLAAALAHRPGSGRRVLLITSSTVSSEEVQGFISDPATSIRDYDVVLTSPSLGTGVDISLADNSKLVDVVFGFFEPHTNHLEIDQQLARVRDPGAIKVWITARRWNYETEFEIVREDIMRQSLFKNVLKGYTAEGAPQYDATDPFINMAALIVSRDRASKNNLRMHFVAHKRQQGYEVQSVSKDEDRSAIGLQRAGRSVTQHVTFVVAQVVLAIVPKIAT